MTRSLPASRPSWTWIASPGELERALADWSNAEAVALDTEFRFERTYRPELALFQVATPSGIWLLDPLAVTDLSRLRAFLEGTGPLKYLHALAGDCAALRGRGLLLNARCLDTQVAAAFCGFRLGTSLAELARELLGLDLPKSETRSNWMQRPLAAGQLQYAALDVQVVQELGERLQSALEAQHRWSWALEESERAARAACCDPDPATVWQRLEARWRLSPSSRERAWALLCWREQTARKLDLARPFLLRDETLLDLARRGLDALSAPEKLRGFDPVRHRKWLTEWGQVLSGETPSDPLPPPASHSGSDPTRRRLESLLRQWVQDLARHHGLPAELLLPRSERASLLGSGPAAERVERLARWRRELFGEALVRLLEEA